MRTSFLVGGLVATSTIFGCGSDEGPTQTITIGAVIDQTSTTAWSSWTTVGNMAVDQLNSALKGAGNPIRFELAVADTQQSFAVAVTAAQDAVAAGAKALITDTTKNAVEVTKLMYDADLSNEQVPITCVTCTGPSLNNPAGTATDPTEQLALRDAENWTFRTVHRGTEQTMILKNVILGRGVSGDVNIDSKLKVTVVALNDDSGHGYVKSVLSLFSVVPGVIVEKVTIDGANKDVNDNVFWDGIAAQLVDNNSGCIQDPNTTNACLPAATGDGFPDALMENLNPGYNIALSQALVRAQNKITFFHAHAFRATQIADILRSGIDDQQGVSGILYDESPSGLQFAADVTGATGSGPTLLDASMYDAVVMNALAILKASNGMADPTLVTGAEVRAAMEQLNDKTGATLRVGVKEFGTAVEMIQTGAAFDYEGASGPVDFDVNGNVVMRLSLYQGENGAFVDRAIYNCIESIDTCPKE